MPLPRRPEDITAEDIRRLVDGRERESRSLDYKGRYNFDKNEKPDPRVELRKDVAALANAGGGYIVVGVEEEEVDGKRTGYPSAAVGVSDPERQRQTIREVVQANIAPPLRVTTVSVPGFERGDCIVVHVHKSFRGPHMTTDNHAFPIRRDDNNKFMSADELRHAFLESGDWGRRAREWIDARVDNLIAYPGLPSLIATGSGYTFPRLFLHVGSVEGVTRGSVQSLVDDATRDNAPYLPFERPCIRRFTFDGVAFVDNETYTPTATNLFAYSLVFRDGWVEFALLLNDDDVKNGLMLDRFARNVENQVGRVVRRFLDLELTPPYFARLTLHDVRGHSVYPAPHKIDQKTLRLPEVILDDDLATDDAKALRRAFRPIFDQIAQASGRENAG